ncbi:unnamed protein product [Gongylonema pulchrum]|uniref:Protein kinase domain-containing protein n=1 Tax=Gongylonema pulchrum TaxID=637853 RepID=A0A3P6PGB6_9BILA|nr:unnamed protein product [Gongylonema pulchrum]
MQGICFCHQRAIIHRDLKSQNLLIDPQKGVIKLADFGLARAVNVPVRAYTQNVAKKPELLKRSLCEMMVRPLSQLTGECRDIGRIRYEFGVDIWSIGCIFVELATKSALFPGDSEIDQIIRIFRHAMLVYDPARRISAKRLLRHEYFSDVDRSLLPAGDYDGSSLW